MAKSCNKAFDMVERLMQEKYKAAPINDETWVGFDQGRQFYLNFHNKTESYFCLVYQSRTGEWFYRIHRMIESSHWNGN